VRCWSGDQRSEAGIWIHVRCVADLAISDTKPESRSSIEHIADLAISKARLESRSVVRYIADLAISDTKPEFGSSIRYVANLVINDANLAIRKAKPESRSISKAEPEVFCVQ